MNYILKIVVFYTKHDMDFTAGRLAACAALGGSVWETGGIHDCNEQVSSMQK